MRFLLRLLAGAFACGVAAAALGTAMPAFATGPAIQIRPPYGPPMTVVKIVGAAFCPKPCSPVSIRVSSLYVANDVPVSSGGHFTAIVRIPDSVSPGANQVVAQQSDAHGANRTAYGTFTVTVGQPAPTHYRLTGSPPPPGGLPAPSQASTRPPRPTHQPSRSSASPTRAAVPTLRPSASPTPSVQPVAAQEPVPAHGSKRWVVYVLVVVAAAAGTAGVVWRRRSARG